MPLKDDGNGNLYVDEANIKYYRNGDMNTGETPNLSFANSYTPKPTPTPTASPVPAATATPASVIPRTADSFPLALLIGLAIVSCGALGILYTAKKRRK